MLRWLSLALISCTSLVGFPQHAVGFQDYPVPLRFRGKPAPPLHNTPYSKLYRTMMRNAEDDGPNFADHFTVAKWGCGAGCVLFSIVDATDGRVYDFPYSVSWLDENPYGIDFHRDSRALRVVGMLNEQGTSAERWYLWNGKDLKLISTEPAHHSHQHNPD